MGTAAFAEETLVPEAGVVPIDRAAPLELAALVGCALSTGVGAVWHTARVEPGATVAVIGCGGVGLSVVQGARAGRGVGGRGRRPGGVQAAAWPRRMGATAVIDPAAGRPGGRRAGRSPSGRGPDFAFEVVGRAATIRQAFAMTRKGGTTVLVGAGSPAEEVSFTAMELFVDAKTIVGCVYGSTDADRDFPVLVDLVDPGTIDADAFVTRRISLDDLPAAFEALEAGEVARSVIIFDGPGT